MQGFFASGFPNQIRSSRPRANVLGVGISAVTMSEAVSETLALIQEGGRGYICVTGVHGVMEAQRDVGFFHILNNSFMTTPDGMPTVWIGRHQGFHMERVYGPDFMLEVCREGLVYGLRHFLYGGKPEVAHELKSKLCAKVPGLEIVGTLSPPFRPLTARERLHFVSTIQEAAPHVIWVGLSTPKQERFMAELIQILDVPVMVGVGAAFDIHTGRINDAPEWVKRCGLQWLHRLIQEPARLWRRYLVNNAHFACAIALQSIRHLIRTKHN